MIYRPPLPYRSLRITQILRQKARQTSLTSLNVYLKGKGVFRLRRRGKTSQSKFTPISFSTYLKVRLNPYSLFQTQIQETKLLSNHRPELNHSWTLHFFLVLVFFRVYYEVLLLAPYYIF
jgi:hypothetical protein